MKLQRGTSGARQTRSIARLSGTEVCRRISVHRSSGLGACSTWTRPSAVMCAHQFIGDLAAASYEASRRPAAQYVEAEEEDEDEDYDEDGDEDGDEEGAEQGGEEAGAQQGATAEEDPKDEEKTKQQQGQQQQLPQQPQQPQQPASEATLKAGTPAAAAAAPATAAAAATAAALPTEAKKDEDELVTQEYTEVIEVWDKPLTFQSVATDTVTWVRETNPGKAAAVTLAGTLLGTFALACHRYYRKYQSPKNVRKRQLARNKLLVDELSKVLPSDRAKLTPSFLKILGVRTGFTPVEIFRKYLWFMLRERKFDQGAVDDVVALKHAAGLKDEDVAEALRERSQRIYDKYGTLMLNTEGMTDAGIQRKAACQALFRKLMYLIQYEPLIKMGVSMVDLRKIFGATEEDTEKLRIVSLYEDADLEKAYGLTITLDDDDDATSAASPRRNS